MENNEKKIIISEKLLLIKKQNSGNCILLLSDIHHKYNSNDFGLSSDSIFLINKIVELEVFKIASSKYKESTNSLNISSENFMLDIKKRDLNNNIKIYEKLISQYNTEFDNKKADLKYKTVLFKISSIICIITLFLLTINIF